MRIASKASRISRAGSAAKRPLRRVAPGVEVRPVRSRGDLTRFIKLPFALYRDAAQWVPPLISERRRHLDRRRNPFFQHADAEYFLAFRDGAPVGRISAHVDHRLNEVQGEPWGLFGFFECEQDADSAHALLATAEEWLAGRGLGRMLGPMDFTTNHECGLLVEGFERAPQVLEFWHHPYYADLLEGYGLEKAMDLYKWKLDPAWRADVMPVIEDLAKRLEPEHGITLRHMRRRDFREEVRRFFEVYNVAWQRNWGFVPLTNAELDHYAKEVRPILDEDWAMVCETADGETAGVALTLPDYNQVLAELNGRLLPFGWLKALRARRRIHSFRVFALGVKPEYQHTGVAARLYVEHWDVAARKRMWGEMGWILETNTPMNRAMEAMGGKIVKRYRIYGKPLGEG